MSTIRVSNIQDTSGGNTSTPAAIANGIAKAWVNFNGTGTVAVRASYNVSSITDNGVGLYTVNFTTAMTDANFALSISGNRGDTGGQADIAGPSGLSPATTTSIAVRTDNDGGTLRDTGWCSVAIFR